jgi:hypothetical protein
VTQPPLGQGLGKGVAEPARGIGHDFGQSLGDGPRLDGGPGDAQPGRQQIRVLDTDASQVLGGGTAAPFQGHATGGLGIGQVGMEGVALLQIGDLEVGVGGTVANGHRIPATPVHLGQQLEQEGPGDLTHGPTTPLKPLVPPG